MDDTFREAVKGGAQKVIDDATAAQKASGTTSATPTSSPAPTPTPNAADAHAATSAPTATPTATPPSSNTASTGTTTSPTPTPTPTPATDAATTGVQKEYYNLLSTAGLITMPGEHWLDRLTLAKIPGILLSALLLSLGAPFWYGRLQDLLRLRSAIAKSDADQRTIRQTTQTPSQGDDSSGTQTTVVRVAMAGEQGDPNAVG